MDIIKLEKDFVKKRYEGWDKPVHFIQLAETETAYLYKREIGSYVDYEVFKKKVVNKTTRKEGKIVELDIQKETYPRANAFGFWAWSFRDINEAYDMLREITPCEVI